MRMDRIIGNKEARVTRGTIVMLGLIMILAGSPAAVSATEGEARPREIYAHMMACYPVAAAATFHHRQNDAHRVRHDGSGGTNRRGGRWRNWDLYPSDMGRLSLEEAADLEIRRAMRAGLDGFAVDAWAGGGGARNYLEAMFKVALENDYDFKLTVCIDPNARMDGLAPYPHTIATVKWLVDNYGDHPKLARRDGKPLIFGYQSRIPAEQYFWDVMWRGQLPEGWPSGPDMRARDVPTDEQREKVRAAVRRLRGTELGWQITGEAWGSHLEDRVDHPLYVHFCMSGFNTRGNPEAAIQALADQGINAVGQFLNPGGTDGTDRHAAAAHKAGIEWSEPLWYQYENLAFRTHVGRGTQYLRDRWERAMANTSTLIQFVTWNDYTEATNLAPGYNNRYAVMLLNRYYIDWWKNGEPPVYDRDKVFLFSRKYNPFGQDGEQPKGFPFELFQRQSGAVEVVTILTEPAIVRLPGRGHRLPGDAEFYEAPAGLHVVQLSLNPPGPVIAELYRDDELVMRVESPEPISERPFRQDQGIVGFSSEYERQWRMDFGDAPVEYFSEYGDDDGDGLPNWFEMYWFGKFLDWSTATVAAPDADPNADGKTNLQHYLDQTDPTKGL